MLIQMRKNKAILIIALSLVFLSACSTNDNAEKENTHEQENQVVNESYETKFSLDGINYRLPVKYETLEKNGWEVNTDIDMDLEPNTYVGKKFLRNGSYIIEVMFYNNTDSKIPMKDAMIAQIGSENREFGGDVPTDLTLKNGINLDSTIEDVISVYGEYTLSEGEVYDTYIFEHDKTAKLQVKYDKAEQYIRWLIITDFKE